MTTIKINANELAKNIILEIERVGSTSWDIYTHKDGGIDCRHNTHDNDKYIEIYDLYSGWDADGLGIDSYVTEDDDGTVDISDIPTGKIEELAAWLVTVIFLDELAISENDSRDEENHVTLEWDE